MTNLHKLKRSNHLRYTQVTRHHVRTGINILTFLAIETCLISYTIRWKLQGGVKVDMYRHAHVTMELPQYSTFGFGYRAIPDKSLPI